ncbi:BTAD domain-containing putative transcriptional regulator [Nocardia sp. NPDC049737]|uniref:AfsR/SARP family transcriptional regulator n=1 Tax=Nocardia sp. NPDC049737 TaxID=3154358 RepID=UPI003449081A
MSLLGPVEAWLGDRRLDSVTPQMLTVLVILAAEPGRTLSIADLAARVWTDRPPASAVGGLRNHVHALRRQFENFGRAGAGAEWLGSTRGGYRLALPVRTDVAVVEELLHAAEFDRRFGATTEANEKLVAAKRLWRGDPLFGLPGPWVEKEQARLQQLRSTLEEATIGVAVDLGRYSAAIAQLRGLVRTEPYVEHWYELLMVALYRAGRRVEALEVYRTAHRALAEELGLEPGPRLVELHQKILVAESPPAAAEPAKTTGMPATGVAGAGKPAEVSVPAVGQLPRGIAGFVGREELVEELAGALGGEEGHRPVITITGMGGIGKTTLAVRLAYQLRDRFPDGVVYLDLDGMNEQVPATEMLLAVAFRSLGVDPGELPRDSAERAGRWRSMAAGKRMLLILDDARDLAQLTPLLPDPGAAAVIVTSRSSLAELFDARLVPLPLLSTGEARQLLEAMLPKQRLSEEPDAVQAILRECGHLPLSLRIVGARLASRPSWRLAGLAERLADERSRLAEFIVGNTSIESVFWTSYRRLAPESARAFVLIAFSEAPDLPVAAIAALLDRDPAETERCCETLVDLGMLQTPEQGRYRYHSLLRLFARQIADPAQRQEWPHALHRLVDFHLATAKNIVALRDLGMDLNFFAATTATGQAFTHKRQGTAWAITERFGLMALFRQVAASSDTRTRTLAVDLALALTVGGDAEEHLPCMVQSLDALARLAEIDGDRRTMGRAQLIAARSRLIGGGDLNAEHAFNHATETLREVGDCPPHSSAN